MSQIRGKTLARYGNPHHSLTLAGGELIFYHSPVKDAAAGRSAWTFKETDLGSIDLQELGRARVEDDGTFRLSVQEPVRTVLVAFSTRRFADAPETGRTAEGIVGTAALSWNEGSGEAGDDSEQSDGAGRELVAAMHIDLIQSATCAILEQLGLWLVAGRVVDCDTKEIPMVGGKVEAFDRDLTQDDFLGSDETDATGSFQIFFDESTFEKIPSMPPPFDSILPHELFGGPDLFFHVSQDAVKVLEEPPSTGRTPGRENVKRCSFTELCVKAPTWTPQTVTLWSKIGSYQVPDGGGLHDFRADGLTASGLNAFHGNIDFVGQLSQTYLGHPTRLRFVFAEWPNPTGAAPAYPADFQPLLAANLNLNQPYGSIYQYLGPNPWNYTLTPVKPAPDAQGWIAVDQSPNFVRDTGVMVQVLTGSLVPAVGSLGDLEGVSGAGDPVPAGPLRDRPRKFSFVLEIKAGPVTVHQAVPVPIHINNSFAYLRFDLTELQADACAGLSSAGGSITVHPVYTAAHPYLDSYGISVQRQGGTLLGVKSDSHASHGPLWTPPQGEHGSETAVYTDVGKCSYRAYMTASRRLTNGYGGPGGQNVLRTFCVD